MAIGTPVTLKELSVNSTGQSSITLVLTTGAAVGDLVVVCLAYGRSSSPSSFTVTDTGGNTWQLDRRDDKTTNNTPHTAIFSAVLTTALAVSDTITVTPDVTINYPIAAAYKVSGVASSSWLDQATGSQGVSSSPSSGSVTTTEADEILFGAVCSGGPQAFTPGSGWTELTDTGNTTKRLAVQYRIESATGSYTSDGTLAASADWTDSIVSYKAAASGITATPDQGSATAAGQTPTVAATSTPDQAAAIAAGQDATARATATPAAGEATAAGQTPTAAVVATPDQGAATADGQTPTVAVTATPDQGAGAADGAAPTPAVTATPDQAAATAAADTPTVTVVATPDQGSATADGYAPTLSTGGGDIVAEPDQGSATADGQTPTVAVTATPAAGEATADGEAPTVAIVVTPATGEATADGYAPTVLTPITATPDVGEATADGYPPTIVIGGAAAAGYPPVLVLPSQARELAEWAALELDDEEATLTILALALTD